MNIEPMTLAQGGQRLDFFLYRKEPWGNYYRCIYRAIARSIGIVCVRKNKYVFIPANTLVQISGNMAGDLAAFMVDRDKTLVGRQQEQ